MFLLLRLSNALMEPDDGQRDKVLPPPEERRLCECLDRKFMTSEGVRWIPRLCCLTQDRLSFAKLYQADEMTRWLQNTDANDMTLSALREIFTRLDADDDGSVCHARLPRPRTARSNVATDHDDEVLGSILESRVT
jgi:hypothetical protein